MKNLLNTIFKFQKYLLAAAIFLVLSAVSVSTTNGKSVLLLGNYPMLICVLVALGVLLFVVYTIVDKQRIDRLTDQIIYSSSPEDSASFLALLSDLTARQREVYDLILSGKSNKEIKAELFIEQSTLKSHINQLYKKLQVKNRKELKAHAKPSKH